MLNLGCGNRYHDNWTNINFVKSGKGVIAYDLNKGIPFDSSTFDVVYHSHVLEHFSKQSGENFIKECYRVLEPNGIIRVVVPDLEQIVRNYIECLMQLEAGNQSFEAKYDWILLEMFDQMTRNKSGGIMADYLKQDNVPQLDFIYNRVGYEAKNIRDKFLSDKKESFYKSIAKKIIYLLEKVPFFKKYRIGAFRQSGEIHQWMYDRYSLSKLLIKCNFQTPKVVDAEKSEIPNWNTYKFLDIENGIVRKPDSLFMEARKII